MARPLVTPCHQPRVITARPPVTNQSFKTQYEFGIKVLEKFGVYVGKWRRLNKYEWKSKKIVEKHIASDLIIESVAMTADYKTNNREAKKLKRLLIAL